jgi:hypothetical protein
MKVKGWSIWIDKDWLNIDFEKPYYEKCPTCWKLYEVKTFVKCECWTEIRTLF